MTLRWREMDSNYWSRHGETPLGLAMDCGGRYAHGRFRRRGWKFARLAGGTKRIQTAGPRDCDHQTHRCHRGSAPATYRRYLVARDGERDQNRVRALGI